MNNAPPPRADAGDAEAERWHEGHYPSGVSDPAVPHVHYDDFYDPAGELDDDFDYATRNDVAPILQAEIDRDLLARAQHPSHRRHRAVEAARVQLPRLERGADDPDQLVREPVGVLGGGITLWGGRTVPNPLRRVARSTDERAPGSRSVAHPRLRGLERIRELLGVRS